MKKLKIAVSVLAFGVASSVGAAEDGLVAHFTFDDAANFMFDRVQGKAIGTVYNTNHSKPEDVAAPTVCEAPHVRGLQVAAKTHESPSGHERRGGAFEPRKTRRAFVSGFAGFRAFSCQPRRG